MINFSFLSIQIFFFICYLLFRIFSYLKTKKFNLKQEFLYFLMYINLAIVIRFVFFPRALLDGKIQPLVFDYSKIFPIWFNIVPLKHLFDYDNLFDILWNVLGNSLLFVPTGILLPIVNKRLNTFPRVILSGALISLCIEIIQLPFFDRASDIDDIILNTLGVALGYGIYKIFNSKNK